MSDCRTMSPEVCAALNHSWLCLKDGYYCPVCNRSFPLGIWAKSENDKIPVILELAAKASCPKDSCNI